MRGVYELQGEVGRLELFEVVPDTPAARAGLVEGDVIVAIDDLPLTYQDEFERAHAMETHRAGDVLDLSVVRDQGLVTLSVKLVDPPSEWEERFVHWLRHREIDEAASGWALLERLSQRGAIEITFSRDGSCRLRAEAGGVRIPTPLSAAAALRLLPLLQRLRPGDSLTLRTMISGNTLSVDAVKLPAYLGKRDLVRAAQETRRRLEGHGH
jgi:membrane-associated protease RseP (regulator of RpoE activity)